jgi:hypothetical protein
MVASPFEHDEWSDGTDERPDDEAETDDDIPSDRPPPNARVASATSFVLRVCRHPEHRCDASDLPIAAHPCPPLAPPHTASVGRPPQTSINTPPTAKPNDGIPKALNAPGFLHGCFRLFLHFFSALPAFFMGDRLSL